MRYLFVALLVFSLGCGAHAPIRLMVHQRAGSDCATAALATLANVNYDYVAMKEYGLKMQPNEPKSQDEIAKIAAALGLNLVPAPLPTDGTVNGILVVRITDYQSHAVTIADGYVYDPLGDLPVKFESWLGSFKLLYFLRKK